MPRRLSSVFKFILPWLNFTYIIYVKKISTSWIYLSPLVLLDFQTLTPICSPLYRVVSQHNRNHAGQINKFLSLFFRDWIFPSLYMYWENKYQLHLLSYCLTCQTLTLIYCPPPLLGWWAGIIRDRLGKLISDVLSILMTCA